LRKGIPLLALSIVLAVPPAARAVEDYDVCVELVSAAPSRAEAEAAAWRRAGGGAAAGHCQALALMALGADLRAAELLVDIAASDRTLPESVRATLLIEAGELFLGLGALEAGQAAAAQARKLAPDARPALALSARLKAEAGDWPGAVADLDRALADSAPDAELLALRASAQIRLGRLVAARSDLLWAAEIDPDLAVIWLERGTLAAAEGNADAARAAWLKAIELSRDSPDAAVAEAARLRIQKLEAGGN
jgi:tetratricopeptide (TPR) repeat protein